MAENNLTDFEAQELLRQYSSDLRKLEFQLQQTKLAINHLQGAKLKSENDLKIKKTKKEVEIIQTLADKPLTTEPKIKAGKKPVEKPGKVKAVKVANPKKSAVKEKVPGKKGRNPLNTQWDVVISDHMGTKENPTTSQDLLQVLIDAREKKYIPDEGNTKLIQRLNASLTKLSKQNRIGKQKIEGKKAFVYFKNA
ncbi:MAG: hypothetical protein KGQ86_00235 [Bacteroidetes bacterium]|nr:hypothetical protein [Bacteroidota bacterium]